MMHVQLSAMHPKSGRTHLFFLYDVINDPAVSLMPHLLTRHAVCHLAVGTGRSASHSWGRGHGVYAQQFLISPGGEGRGGEGRGGEGRGGEGRGGEGA